MNIDVAGLRVIVTAGGQGIGRAIADAFLTNGAQVHICDVDPDRLAACRADLPTVGTSVADVSQPDQVDAFIDAAITRMGGVDVLVNNAGISGPAGAIETIDPADWQRTMAVNINGQFFCARRVIPHLKAQRSGSIVNIATTAALFGYPNRSPYASSKWAVIGFTKTLAMELGAYGIRANAICPGSINNPRMDHVIAIESAATNRPQAEIRRSYERQVSMQTFIDPEEIAHMVLFICSPLGAKISGQALSVDGHTETMRT
jgi:NAD(P)-dependent dehydrogenase (short-subunit alcohol dehydrogenase family)